jgi:TIR domain
MNRSARHSTLSEWLSEEYAGIEAAGSILLVISPNSVSSEICNKEIEHALANGKRIIPLLWWDLIGAEQQNLNSKIYSLNWILFRATDDFDLSFRTLMKAIDTDLDWVHSHTRVLIRAREWEDAARDRSFLLRGRDLGEAERWLAGRGPDREPSAHHPPLRVHPCEPGRCVSTSAGDRRCDTLRAAGCDVVRDSGVDPEARGDPAA